VQTVSQVKGISIQVNVTLDLNLATSTFKSAHVDSVLVTFNDVDTSCSIGPSATSGLEDLCSVIDSQMTARLRKFVEGPLSASLKDALQASLDLTLPVGPGSMLTEAAEAASPPLEPRRLLLKTAPLVSARDVLV